MADNAILEANLAKAIDGVLIARASLRLARHAAERAGKPDLAEALSVALRTSDGWLYGLKELQAAAVFDA